jgi:hypothetical protein
MHLFGSEEVNVYFKGEFIEGILIMRIGIYPLLWEIEY